MGSFIARRLISGAVLLVVITTLAFLLLYAGGGDIARKIMGDQATQEAVAQEARELALNRPVLSQYSDWLRHAVQGDLGVSWFNGQQVTRAVTTRLSVTLSLVIGAITVAALLAILLGVTAALRRGWADRVIQVGAVIAQAIPNFLVALFLVLVFAINLKLFRATGYVQPATNIGRWINSITLPVAALCIGSTASVTQQIRGSVIDTLRQDYVRTLRARGLSFRRTIFKHVLRNAGGPALAVLAVQFVGMLGGAVIIEQVFAIPGLGQISVLATQQGDIPLVMGLVLVMAVIVVIVNLAIDLIQGWLNPKVRLR